ncbi:MAG: DUF5615 family PIN-like protein [Rhizomicrobium sp.]
MKFFIDHQLPPELALWFQTKGHEATTARRSGLRSIDDRTIWAHCAQHGFIVVSKDEDFANFALTAEGTTVIWVRIGNAVNDVLIARFEAIWPQIEAHLMAGTRLIQVR